MTKATSQALSERESHFHLRLKMCLSVALEEHSKLSTIIRAGIGEPCRIEFEVGSNAKYPTVFPVFRKR